MSLKVLVCGGRDFNNVELLVGWLNTIHDTEVIAVLIEGGQTGADTLARKFAKDKGILCETYKPDWNKYGRAAGPIRNKQMLTHGKPDLLVAFPGHTGTDNMVSQARVSGISGFLINADGTYEEI